MTKINLVAKNGEVYVGEVAYLENKQTACLRLEKTYRGRKSVFLGRSDGMLHQRGFETGELRIDADSTAAFQRDCQSATKRVRSSRGLRPRKTTQAPSQPPAQAPQMSSYADGGQPSV